MSADCIYQYLYEYDESDIKAKSIVLVIQVVEMGKIIVLQNFSELAGLFECLVDINLELGGSDAKEYIDEVIRENESFQIPNSKDQDFILEEYFKFQSKRISETDDDFDRLREILYDYGTSHDVGDFCYLEEYVDGTYFQMWIDDYRDLDDDFDDYEEDDEDISLQLPGSEEIIARTINGVNQIDSL